MPKLTKTVVDAAIPRAKQFTLWCSDLPGFGVYVIPTGNRTLLRRLPEQRWRPPSADDWQTSAN